MTPITTQLKLSLLLSFLICPGALAQKQKSIVISDDLAANATEMKVKMGTQWAGKIWNFRFGEYAVKSSKNGWQTTNTKSNFFNTKTETKSNQKFSFKLENGAGAVANVNAIWEMTMQEVNSFALTPGFYIGSDEVTGATEIFSAVITVSSDTSATWTLLMITTEGTRTPAGYSAVLSDGTRKIFIVPVNSNKNAEDSRSIPALGYEFHETAQPLAAMQYYGGGMLGMNKNIVWIHNRQSPVMQHILAAAITAMLQVKVNSMAE